MNGNNLITVSRIGLFNVQRPIEKYEKSVFSGKEWRYLSSFGMVLVGCCGEAADMAGGVANVRIGVTLAAVRAWLLAL